GSSALLNATAIVLVRDDAPDRRSLPTPDGRSPNGMIIAAPSSSGITYAQRNQGPGARTLGSPSGLSSGARERLDLTPVANATGHRNLEPTQQTPDSRFRATGLIFQSPAVSPGS